MIKKEIYFTSDVFKEVSNKLGVSSKIVEKVFNSYINSFKQNIEESDDIVYKLPYLGELMISKGDCSREIEKLNKRHTRREDVEEKKRLAQQIKNYRIRLKKIKIEVAKINRMRGYMRREKRQLLMLKKLALTTPENIRRKTLLHGTTLEEAMQKQNDYAYSYYEKNNLQVTL